MTGAVTGTVPALSIVFMVFALLVAVGIPIGLFICFRRKGADVKPFVVGCAVMLIFAFLLESLAHKAILGSAAGQNIVNSTWLYALYGGLMAGLFEETGRFVAFKTVLRKDLGKDVNALMYGAGHGGFEAATLVGLTMVNNIIYSVMINAGKIDALTGSLSGDTLVQMQNAIDTLINTSPFLFLASGIERLSAIALHVALSVLVWFAVKYRKLYLFPCAIFIHFVVDAVTVVISKSGASVALLEALVAAMALIAVLIAVRVWRSAERSNNMDQIQEV